MLKDIIPIIVTIVVTSQTDINCGVWDLKITSHLNSGASEEQIFENKLKVYFQQYITFFVRKDDFWYLFTMISI